MKRSLPFHQASLVESENKRRRINGDEDEDAAFQRAMQESLAQSPSFQDAGAAVIKASKRVHNCAVCTFILDDDRDEKCPMCQSPRTGHQWQCSCKAWSNKTEDKCHACGLDKDAPPPEVDKKQEEEMDPELKRALEASLDPANDADPMQVLLQEDSRSNADLTAEAQKAETQVANLITSLWAGRQRTDKETVRLLKRKANLTCTVKVNHIVANPQSGGITNAIGAGWNNKALARQYLKPQVHVPYNRGYGGYYGRAYNSKPRRNNPRKSDIIHFLTKWGVDFNRNQLKRDLLKIYKIHSPNHPVQPEVVDQTVKKKTLNYFVPCCKVSDFQPYEAAFKDGWSKVLGVPASGIILQYGTAQEKVQYAARVNMFMAHFPRLISENVLVKLTYSSPGELSVQFSHRYNQQIQSQVMKTPPLARLLHYTHVDQLLSQNSQGGSSNYIKLDIPVPSFPGCAAAEMATHIVQVVRTTSTNGTHVINFDLTLAFVNYMKILVEKYGVHAADMDTGFHWTQSQNMDKIADTNFYVPGGKGKKSVNGAMYGAGIYHCPNPFGSRNFGRGNSEVIVSLLLPGKFSHGQKIQHGCDSNGDGRAWKSYAVVVYKSSQVLPMFRSKPQDLRTIIEQIAKIKERIFDLIGVVGKSDFIDDVQPDAFLDKNSDLLNKVLGRKKKKKKRKPSRPVQHPKPHVHRMF